jgi:hypothetical protein
MDILALFAAVLEILSGFPRRVTVKDRYEMKKKVRELHRREREKVQKP